MREAIYIQTLNPSLNRYGVRYNLTPIWNNIIKERLTEISESVPIHLWHHLGGLTLDREGHRSDMSFHLHYLETKVPQNYVSEIVNLCLTLYLLLINSDQLMISQKISNWTPIRSTIMVTLVSCGYQQILTEEWIVAISGLTGETDLTPGSPAPSCLLGIFKDHRHCHIFLNTQNITSDTNTIHLIKEWIRNSFNHWSPINTTQHNRSTIQCNIVHVFV